MSKIYNKYLELKNNDKDKLYLFHSGKFYIFIADDADKINEYVVLKQTKFTKEVNKCGFPDSSFDDYIRVFNNHKLDILVLEPEDFELIETINDNIIVEKYNQIKSILKNLDINNTTPIESLKLLNKVLECIND